MPYITIQEYGSLTGDTSRLHLADPAIERASVQLDGRIGKWDIDETTGEKLPYTTDNIVTTFTDLNDRQAAAVRQWVASMTFFILDGGGNLGGVGEVQLGRFKKTKGRAGSELHDAMTLADSALINTGMVRLYSASAVNDDV